jgi:MFS family permease
MLVLIRLVVSASGPKAGGRFDYPGAVLLSGGLTAALLAMSKGGSWGWSSVTTVATAAAGLLLIALWLPVQLVVRHPLVDVRTAARPAVLVVNVVAVLLGFAMYTNSLITTQQLQQPTSSGYGLGLDILQTGLWLVPAMVVFGAMAPVAAMITRRFDARVTLIAGAASLALAWACRAPFSNSLWQVVGGSMLVSVGTSMAFAAMPTLIMSAVPVTQTASANGLNTLLRSVGTSTSSAATAGVLALGVHSVAGKAVPSFGAVVAVFWMAAAASAAAVLIVLLLFRISRRDPPPVPDVLVLTDPAGAVAGPAEHR